MTDLHFTALDSLNFHGDEGVCDVIRAAHRFMRSHHELGSDGKTQKSAPHMALQLSFPMPLITETKRHLGRRVVIFGTKEALTSFWDNNEDTLLASRRYALRKVNSLAKMAAMNENLITGYARYYRQKIAAKESMIKSAYQFEMKHNGLPPKEAYAAAEKHVAKRLKETGARIIGHMDFTSRSDRRVDGKLAIAHDIVRDAKEIKFDPNTISTFGLSPSNIVPILDIDWTAARGGDE